MNVEFQESNFCLNSMEKEIIRNIVVKKKFFGHSSVQFTKEFFNQTRQSKLQKKTEDGLKFIFKKAIKKMKSEFKSTFLKGKTGNKKLDDNLFYLHYYGKIAEEEDIPIECFFHFRNWQNRVSEHIPKSITKEYVRRLNKNPEFVRKIKNYLTEDFLDSFKVFNSKKIRIMIIKWEKIIEEKGKSMGLKEIIRSIHSKGNKIPWTISEVKHALGNSLKYINNC